MTFEKKSHEGWQVVAVPDGFVVRRGRGGLVDVVTTESGHTLTVGRDEVAWMAHVFPSQRAAWACRRTLTYVPARDRDRRARSSGRSRPRA